MSDLWVIFTLIFVAASLAIYGVYWVFVFNRREHKIINRRLELSRQLDGPSAVLDALRHERGFRSIASPALLRYSDWLTQTGVRVQPMSLLLVFVALWLALMVGFSLRLGTGLTSVFLAALVAAGLIFFYLSRQRTRRIAAFSEQLPDAIDIIVRGVRVGLPFSSAVSLVAREMSDPLGTEFGMLSDEMSFGLDVRTALENLSRRVGQEDLLFLTVSVGIQTQTGGNIAEILGRLSRLMRSRSAMQLKVRALTAEGRGSAYILSTFPVVMFVLLNILVPSYFQAIRANQIYEPAIFFGLFLILVGNFVIHRMVNFRY